MVCNDQLDVANLACAETVAREIQWDELETKKTQDAKKVPDGSEYFLGRTRRTGNALICPELAAWATTAAAKDTGILKKQRKAAEKRGLARKK